MKPEKLDLLHCPFQIYLGIEKWTHPKPCNMYASPGYQLETPYFRDVAFWCKGHCLALGLVGAIGLHPLSREKQKRKRHLSLFL